MPGVHAWHRFGAAVQFGILANLFLVVYVRYVDDLFSLDGVEQPDFNSVFIGPTGTATLARRMIQIHLVGSWSLEKPSQTQMCSWRLKCNLDM